MTNWKPNTREDPLTTLTGIPGAIVGEVCGSDDVGHPLVRWDSGREATAAEVLWSQQGPDWAECVGLRVVLAFEDGQASRPIVLGLLDAPPAQPEAETTRKPKTLRVESEEELVIECGKAKIALRSDGRIEIRGGHLISRSSGPNKIKGGTVHIN